jgi:DNA-binding MarR family transcriptional regulator
MKQSASKQSVPKQSASELSIVTASLGYASSTTIQAYFQCRIVYQLLKRLASADIESRGILPASFGILYALQDGKSLSPTELRRFVFSGLSSMTSLIDRMERDGLVLRERDRNDRRRVQIRLTERGQQVCREVISPHVDWVMRMMSVLSDDELAELSRLLAILWQELLSQAEEAGIEVAAISPKGNN